ncbi:MAG: GNAT family N-acetyltransferase [Chloroflexota bacterium]
MTYTVREEDFNGITAYWMRQEYRLSFPSIFVTPPYLESWWQVFGESRLYLASIWQDSTLLGIAPLQIHGETISLIGSPDVCDYLDFITVEGNEEEFFSALLDNLKRKGISELDINPVRGDSRIMSSLLQEARQHGYLVNQEQEDLSLEMALPQTWEDYLKMLDGKSRHELRRKFRRLETADSISYQIAQDESAINTVLPEFLRLFSTSKGKKAAFMTEKMSRFFHTLTHNLARFNLMRFGSLKLADKTISMVMCFDYHDTIYLYNSAYEPAYNHLSPGILAKALYIRDSIEKGEKILNFLKGSETYKYQLGGSEVPIYHLKISL